MPADRLRRHAVALGLALLAGAAPAGAAASGGALPEARPAPAGRLAAQAVARLLAPHQALSVPGAAGKPVVVVQATRPLTGAQTVLPVLARRVDPAGTPWLRVLLPGRPNGRSGWIRAARTKAETTGWHIVVDLAARRVTALRDGDPVRSYAAVIGKPATPTPRGSFFVEEAVALSASEPGAPFALALSAHSAVLHSFDGGDAQVAIHSTAKLAGAPGTAASHGCIRLAAADLRWLVARIGPGTPVTIE